MNVASDIREALERLPGFETAWRQRDPLVSLRLFIPGSNRIWYVIASEPEGDDIVLVGFETACQYRSHSEKRETFSLAFLHRAAEAVGSIVAMDPDFAPKPVSAIAD